VAGCAVSIDLGVAPGNQPGNMINEFPGGRPQPPTIFMPYAVHPLDEFVQPAL
jgi:hypothetical protein